MPTDTPYSIADLARLTDVTPRTVRYYIAQGLLPAPGESGPGAHYGPAHLDRLQLIRRLQRQHLPLAEIRTRLATLSDQEIGEAIRSGEAQRSAQPDSALDYIRTVLGSSLTLPAASRLALPGSARPSMPMAPEPMPGPPASVLAETRSFAVMSVAASRAAAEPGATEEAHPEPRPLDTTIERSQWERLSLGPNVELHIRRPLSRLEQKRVDRLVTIARQVLQEGTS